MKHKLRIPVPIAALALSAAAVVAAIAVGVTTRSDIPYFVVMGGGLVLAVMAWVRSGLRIGAETPAGVDPLGHGIFLVRFEHGATASIDAPEFWDLLASAWEAPPDERGFVRLVRDGGEADVYAEQSGATTESVLIDHIDGEGIMNLIVELAREGDLVVVGPGLPTCLTRTEQRAHIPRNLLDLGEPVLVSSGRELAGVIAGG